MPETPRARRIDLTDRPAAVPARLRFNQPLRLLDLSLTGARVETSEWLAPGRRYTIRLGVEPELHLHGDVVRCALVRVDADPEGARAVYEAGVSFHGLNESSLRHLDAIIAGLDVATPPALRLVSGY